MCSPKQIHLKAKQWKYHTAQSLALFSLRFVSRPIDGNTVLIKTVCIYLLFVYILRHVISNFIIRLFG